MGISKNKRITKKTTTKVKPPKFLAMFKAGQFVITGRSPFGTKAKAIKVNQDKSKGPTEDRRHVLHYDEVLKPLIERVMTSLFASLGDEKSVALQVTQSMEALGIKRLPKKPEKVMERLVTEINSAPNNLIPDRADTNKAIEVVRGYIRNYIKDLSTSDFAKDCETDNTARMALYKQHAKKVFVRDATGGDITDERNRMHGEILAFIDGCQGPSQLWIVLHDLVYSVTFDFSPKIARDATVRAMNWQKKMSLNEDAPATQQLEDLLSLLDG